jgi:anion-transporting  ArsA/GET3 family ATPase
VIVDAPATGHGLGLLRTPKTFGDIARVGPVKRQADTIYEFITDTRLTGVVAVAWPEEMPVNETLDLQRKLKTDVGMALDRIVMNGIYPELFTDAEAETLRQRYEQDGGGNGGNGIAAVRRAALRSALSEYTRARAHHEQLRRLEKGSGQDAVELPFLFEPSIDMTAVEALADRMEPSL